MLVNIRIFSPSTLAFIADLPLPRALGSGPQASNLSVKNSNNTVFYPDCTAIRIFESKVYCTYSDKSVIIWDVTAQGKVRRWRNLSGHDGVVWNVKVTFLSPASKSPTTDGSMIGHTLWYRSLGAEYDRHLRYRWHGQILEHT